MATVPLTADREVPVASLAGEVVIDTCTYDPERDGACPELDEETTTPLGVGGWSSSA